ncbi:hypothetical protein BLL52_0269 [Rhodoferax antarcticus ANT.BR]|uniref:Uncharacterized protein n=1 Tax=Rhodoferax antarcticus ANT.BR TaxID=1111071 RepID=A0A1Q8YKS8_9BURK|nr:hypothetical protein BLL52_0269 [Rhodoferax antarcticus ANT.BR]
MRESLLSHWFLSYPCDDSELPNHLLLWPCTTGSVQVESVTHVSDCTQKTYGFVPPGS